MFAIYGHFPNILQCVQKYVLQMSISYSDISEYRKKYSDIGGKEERQPM